MKTKNVIKEHALVYELGSMKKIICSDGFFHYLMENSDRVRLLLCQSLIEEKVIVETRIENVESYHSQLGGKKLILDVVASDEDGNLYNIEMQVGYIDENDFVRFQCYGSKLLEKQEEKGKDYRGIRDIYQLIISDKTIDVLSSYQHDFHMYDKENNISLPYHKIHMRIIQLPKIDDILKEEMQPIEEVMYLFAKGKTRDRKRCKEVEDTWEVYRRYVQSDSFLSDYERFRDEKLYYSKIHTATEDGEYKGIYKIVKRQLENKYHIEIAWLDNCNQTQLEKISEYIFQDITLEELKDKVMISKTI